MDFNRLTRQRVARFVASAQARQGTRTAGGHRADPFLIVVIRVDHLTEVFVILVTPTAFARILRHGPPFVLILLALDASQADCSAAFGQGVCVLQSANLRAGVRTTRWGTVAALLVTIGAGAAAQSGDAGLDSIRADALKGHVFFLAAPEMGGRDSLSLEGRIAANYIAGFFYRLGLKPVGDGGTYFQNFPMSQAVIDRAQTTTLQATMSGKTGGTIGARLSCWHRTSRWHAKAAPTSTSPRRSCLPATASTRRNTATTTTPDSMSTARSCMVLSREPQAADAAEPFKGTWDTFHAYPAWKPEVARRNGAAGILIVQGPPRRPQRMASGPTNGQIRTDRPNHSLTSPFWDLPVFNIDRARRQRAAAPVGQDHRRPSVVASTRAGKPQSTPLAGVTVKMRRAVSERQIVQTRNVVGRHRRLGSQAEGRSTSSSPATTTTSGRSHRSSSTAPTTTRRRCAAVIAIAEALKANPRQAEAQRDVPRLRSRGRLPPGRVPLRRPPDRAARSHRGGAQHGHDRPRRRLADLEHHAPRTAATRVNVVGTLYSPDLRRDHRARRTRASA